MHLLANLGAFFTERVAPVLQNAAEQFREHAVPIIDTTTVKIADNIGMIRTQIDEHAIPYIREHTPPRVAALAAELSESTVIAMAQLYHQMEVLAGDISQSPAMAVAKVYYQQAATSLHLESLAQKLAEKTADLQTALALGQTTWTTAHPMTVSSAIVVAASAIILAVLGFGREPAAKKQSQVENVAKGNTLSKKQSAGGQKGRRAVRAVVKATGGFGLTAGLAIAAVAIATEWKQVILA